MRARFGSLLAIISALLLTTVAVAPAIAAPGEASASGAVDWNSDSDGNPDRRSVFSVQDGTPGEPSRDGDGGWYRLTKSNGASMTMDVACVRIDDGWAEFSGQIVRVTAPFTVGQWFMVSIKDPGKRGDEIGMKHRAGPAQACEGGPTCGIADNGALDECQLNRAGHITQGSIRIRNAR